MTAQLSRERLEALANLQSLECMALPASLAESAEMARMLLAGMGTAVAGFDAATAIRACMEGFPEHVHDIVEECAQIAENTISNRHSAPPAPVVDDYFAALVTQARERANKAMRKFPQPNYVLNKVAEESGEVIKAVIHYTEGREEWRNVEGEIIDNLAMLIRLVQEGDQVIGFTPPTDCRAAMLKAGPVTAATVPDGWKLVPVEPTAEMISSGITAHYERSQIQIHDRPAPGPMECGYVAMLAASPSAPEQEG